jgi:hypothetical protein
MSKAEVANFQGASAVYELKVVRREGDEVSSRRLIGVARSALHAIDQAKVLLEGNESVVSVTVKYSLDFGV